MGGGKCVSVMFSVYAIVDLSCGCEPPCSQREWVGESSSLEAAIALAVQAGAWCVEDPSGVRVWDAA